ncbi:carbohydrate kinase [Mangrovactinospora gilvigrisea]|uniref:Carbohydrate kinase n=1 Tax=Mangrovactinospora gilvigrisea TaxID=1428644 RepID=A0A1J7BAS1_9ACTN|nr:FGGY family carbohydrate kinase [Mangrovactinospora gilvigrisea]OIV35701.1 carbohydrate kinase [Mangrovactinospora gilvigrisea]
MIVGVDVGTSVTKAQLLGRDGRSGPVHEARGTLRTAPGGRVEQDLDEVVRTVEEVVRAAAADAAAFDGQPGETLEALAITGQGDGLWLRDADGRSVGPAISWLDGRASDRVARWSQPGPDGAEPVLETVHRLTGSGMFPGSAGPLLAHLAEREPERLERAAVAGYCVDAVVQRFTGEITVDASDASLPFLDVPSRTYNEAAVAACGLTAQRRLLAEPAAPGQLFALLPEAALRLGLPSGLPVSAGPFDIPACGFGAGLSEAGQGNLILGTTLACTVRTDKAGPQEMPGFDAQGPAGMWLATPYPDRHLRVMPAMVGTAGLDWVLGLIGAGVGDLEDLLAASPAGANGVTALPFLSPGGERAPFVDALARGRFDGLNLAAGRADLVRALCEAVAYSARHCMEALGLAGEVSACGGGARSAAWSRIFADVLGRDLHIPVEEGVGVRGAAKVAWDALGAPVGEERVRGPRRVVRADPAAAEHYEAGYGHYRAELERARADWHAPHREQSRGYTS